jgi:hypothetical protein
MYRFRTIDNLLDKHNELENQEIYFASIEELNDPMEGYRDIFWSGDVIVWKNLLKNYVECVEHIFLLNLVAGETKKIDTDDIPLYLYPNTKSTLKKETLLKGIFDAFFSHDFVKKTPEALSKRNNSIRRNELLSYLYSIHPFAINAVAETYFNNGLTDTILFQSNLERYKNPLIQNDSIVELMNEIEIENKKNNNRDIADILSLISTNLRQQALLLGKYNLHSNEVASNHFFLLSDFPEKFIAKLETLTYPNWYSASFLNSCDNSAVWGHYGDRHKGVCLIYKTIENDGQLRIKLTTQNGRGFQNFHQVEYDKNYIEIDFFRSLGRSPQGYLYSKWYRDDEGNVSICSEHLTNNTEQWRKNYWDNFYKALKVKLKEWVYEDEYRLIVEDGFHNYVEKDSRKAKYEFEDLTGIIFGIKTSTVDKIRILKIIREKCKKENRKEFDFYQAYYSKETKKIEQHKLDILKVD